LTSASSQHDLVHTFLYGDPASRGPPGAATLAACTGAGAALGAGPAAPTTAAALEPRRAGGGCDRHDRPPGHPRSGRLGAPARHPHEGGSSVRRAARVVAFAPGADLACVAGPGLAAGALALAPAPATEGDAVVSLGYSLGGPLRSATGTVTQRHTFEVSDIWL